MKVHKFTIPGRLDGMNEIIAANRKSPCIGAKEKRKQQDIVIKAIKFYRLKGVRNYPVTIKLDWYEKNGMRDPDNICAAKKFIFDALQETDVLRNDGSAEIKGFREDFHIDKLKPRIEVTITESEA